MKTKLCLAAAIAAAFPLTACTGAEGPRGLTGDAGAQGPSGPAGPQGAAGDSGTSPFANDAGAVLPGASVNAVIPAQGLIDRTTPVQLSFFATAFSATDVPTLDFGPGVTVKNVVVLTPTLVSAQLEIARTAAVGARDVIAKLGTQTYTAPGAFTVQPGITVRVVSGTPQQGGLMLIEVKNNDVQNAFNPATLKIIGSPGIGDPFDQLQYPTTTIGYYYVAVDPTAPPGPMQFGVGNFPFGRPRPEQSFYSSPSAITVVGRTPTTLTAGAAPLSETIPAVSLGTNLYRITTTEAGIVDLSLQKTGTMLEMAWAAYPSSGKMSDVLKTYGYDPDQIFNLPATQAATFPAAEGTTLYFQVSDAAARGGVAAQFGYNIGAAFTAAPAITESTTAHASAGAAQVIADAALPGVVSGNISAPGEVDIYRIDLASPGNIEVSFSGLVDVGTLLVTSDNTFATGTDFTPAAWRPSSPTTAQRSNSTTTTVASSTWYVGVAGGGATGRLTGTYALSVRKR